MLSAAESCLQSGFQKSLQRLFQFIKIPSISTDDLHVTDCAAAANWLVGELTDIGFDTSLLQTARHPAVLAHGPRVENAPHVLFYGHYDVQPVDPLTDWEFPPFEPALLYRDGRAVIHGRGTADDKGQLMTFVEACRALHRAGGYPLNISMLIEGEEEIGSPSIGSILAAYSTELRADIALICDTSMLAYESPAIGCQLRGFVGEIVSIKAAARDLHSGDYGGAARNPAIVMAKALASLVNLDGTINLPGFYEGVSEIPELLKRDWHKLETMGASLLRDVGLATPAGEAAYSVLEQIWARPSFDINSLWSGYIGHGFKTVLPSVAHAKVSFRLVGTQDPDSIREKFRTAISRSMPEDCTVTFEAFGTVPAVQMDIDRPEFRLIKDAIREVWNDPCVFIGMGGSIPIVREFKAVLGVDSVLLGFGLADDKIHSANEKYDLRSFQKGALSWLRVLQAIGAEPGGRRTMTGRLMTCPRSFIRR
ncbi:M20/M25/M40 family metallo-hydrolase [Methylosinus sporium]|uniref:M20/M25/M40 family metallo-hydrolase n=1 Tax=Methylosinus sporium TaxID=428 RepID=UPI0013301139|nr:M20/M25/M40 family metallo-hydrolase [Methylosinus sporium]